MINRFFMMQTPFGNCHFYYSRYSPGSRVGNKDCDLEFESEDDLLKWDVGGYSSLQIQSRAAIRRASCSLSRPSAGTWAATFPERSMRMTVGTELQEPY
jgi:hypothetical protein